MSQGKRGTETRVDPRNKKKNRGDERTTPQPPRKSLTQPGKREKYSKPGAGGTVGERAMASKKPFSELWGTETNKREKTKGGAFLSDDTETRKEANSLSQKTPGGENHAASKTASPAETWQKGELGKKKRA